MLKFQSLKKLIFSDHHQSVLDNLELNIKANEIDQDKYQIQCLDWKDNVQADLNQDLIIGSDIVFDTRLIPFLVQVIGKQPAIIANVLRNEETKKAFEDELDKTNNEFSVQVSDQNMLLYKINMKNV